MHKIFQGPFIPCIKVQKFHHAFGDHFEEFPIKGKFKKSFPAFRDLFEGHAEVVVFNCSCPMTLELSMHRVLVLAYGRVSGELVLPL
jgi:hypothetical protein